MDIVCIRHVHFEGPANIARWAERRGHVLRETHVHDGQPLPAPSEFDLLVMMGGPMSVNDEETLPWLRAEKRLVRDALAAGRRVLGVCLGAQMIAAALGARVYRNPVKEIGWFPIQAVPGRAATALGMPASLEVFHWHGETFDLPEGAERWAGSTGCRNQAFLYQGRALAMQFHVEVTLDSAERMLRHAGHEIGHGPFEQPPAALLARPERFTQLEPALFDWLDRFVALDATIHPVPGSGEPRAQRTSP